MSDRRLADAAARLAARETATPGELVGLADIAARLGVRYKTTTRWRDRGVLPPPFATVSGSAIWRRSTIETWARQTGRELSGQWPDAGRLTIEVAVDVAIAVTVAAAATVLLVLFPHTAGAMFLAVTLALVAVLAPRR